MFEALAPGVSDAVEDADTVELPDTVEEGVVAPVPVPDSVALPVGVPVPLWLGVPLLEREVDGVLLADAPSESEGVGEDDTVEEALWVEEGVAAAVPVPLDVSLPVAAAVPVPLPVALLLGVDVGVRELVALPLKEALPVPEAEAPGERGGVALPDCVLLALRVAEGLALTVRLALGVAEPAPVPEPENAGAPLAEATWEGAGVSETVGGAVAEVALLPVGAPEAVPVPVAAPTPDSVLEPVAVLETSPLGEAAAVRVPAPRVGEGASEALLLEAGCALPVAVPEAEGATAAEGGGDREVLPLALGEAPAEVGGGALGGPLGEALAAVLPEPPGGRVALAEGSGVAVAAPEAVPQLLLARDSVEVGVSVLVGEPVTDTEAPVEAVEEAVPLLEGVAVGDTVPDTVRAPLVEGVGDPVGEAVGVGEAEREGEGVVEGDARQSTTRTALPSESPKNTCAPPGDAHTPFGPLAVAAKGKDPSVAPATAPLFISVATRPVAVSTTRTFLDP